MSDDALWVYKAKYVHNYDGDTVDLVVDLGFRVQFQMRIRLFGINSPELRGSTLAAGNEAKMFLYNLLIGSGETLRLRSYKDQADKYGGRWLGELLLPVNFKVPGDPKTAFFDPKGGALTNLNQLMIQAGHAVAYNP